MDSLNNSNHGGDSSLDNLKPIFFIILPILLITLLISISLCFLLRCLNRHRRRQFLSSAVESRQYSFSVHRVSPEMVTSSPILDSLPLFKFSSVTRRSTPVTSGDCAVCLSKFEPHDNLRLLPLCCHAFHADCIDKWLISNQSCPLCRSPLFASESDLMKKTLTTTNNTQASNGAGENSFRLEIGSISRRQNISESEDQQRSYSIGSFNYIVDEESEISTSNFHRISSSSKDEDVIAAIEASLTAEIGGGSRNWLDRISRGISSRALSFRGSGRFVTGSSRWNEELTADVDANRAGEEISEFFRWFSQA